jgi:hypothetical protein
MTKRGLACFYTCAPGIHRLSAARVGQRGRGPPVLPLQLFGRNRTSCFQFLHGRYCVVQPRHSNEDSFTLKATSGEEMRQWVLLMQQQSDQYRENDLILLYEQNIGIIEEETSAIQERAWFQKNGAPADN